MGNLLQQVGGYVLMLRRMLYPPENARMFGKRMVQSCGFVGIQSLGLVVLVSFFLGMIAVLLCQYMIDNPIVPHFVVGTMTRDLLLWELTPTGISALLACVIGFRMTFAIGSYRREEQMDALEVMGVNSASYIVFPLVLSSIFMVPLLLVLSFFISLFGGFVLCYASDIIPYNDYIQGLQVDLRNIGIELFFTKIYLYAFIISSIGAYLGYSFSGTVQQLSRRSTTSIAINCLLLILLDYVITDMLLNA
ncbi:MAG: ABC transporter permease [Chitinophagaceae bacterium]